MEKRWYAIYTNPRAEKKVDTRLKDAGLECYCPTRITIKQWSDRKKKIEEPLFRSYCFVRINELEQEKVRRVSGVVNFVYYLSKPAIIRDVEIENIKKFLSRVSHSEIRFEKEDRVRVIEGVMKDIEGIVESQGKNTLRIRIEQLGIALYAEIKKDFVDKLPE